MSGRDTPRLSSDAEGRVLEGSAAQKNWIALLGTVQKLQEANQALAERVTHLERQVVMLQQADQGLRQMFAVSIPRGSGPTVKE